MLQADRKILALKDKAGKANLLRSMIAKFRKCMEKKLSEILPEAEFLGEEEDLPD